MGHRLSKRREQFPVFVQQLLFSSITVLTHVLTTDVLTDLWVSRLHDAQQERTSLSFCCRFFSNLDWTVLSLHALILYFYLKSALGTPSLMLFSLEYLWIRSEGCMLLRKRRSCLLNTDRLLYSHKQEIVDKPWKRADHSVKGLWGRWSATQVIILLSFCLSSSQQTLFLILVKTSLSEREYRWEWVIRSWESKVWRTQDKSVKNPLMKHQKSLLVSYF